MNRVDSTGGKEVIYHRFLAGELTEELQHHHFAGDFYLAELIENSSAARKVAFDGAINRQFKNWL